MKTKIKKYRERFPVADFCHEIVTLYEGLSQNNHQTDSKPGTDDVAGIEVNNLLKADCKYVNRNVKVSIIIHCFCSKNTGT